METPRTFRIDRGIGQYDFNDYYAVLGLPITAESSFVRRQYLLIAKCLHPDIHGRSHSEKQVATQYLSKLVNPAYNVLSQERERIEYSAILKLLGKRLMKRNQKFSPQSDIAKKYLITSHAVNYEQTIHEIAKVQYQDLDRVLEQIGLLSELNLVHILLQEGYKHAPNISSSGASYSYNAPARPVSGGEDTIIQTGNTGIKNTGVNRASSTYPNSAGNSYQMRSESQTPLGNTSNTSNSAANTSAKNTNQTNNTNSNKNNNPNVSLDQYVRQAENYINQKLWASALKELRSAIQVDCSNSHCHALLGFVYMNQKLSGMAKVSFQQALKINPDEPLAKQYIAQVASTNSSNTNSSKQDPKAKNDKKGGFFGWLGGG